jgi:hypothetical protein
VVRLYDRALAMAGLRSAGYSTLSRVDAEGPMTISRLAARLALERTSCSREVEPVKAGLLTVGSALGQGGGRGPVSAPYRPGHPYGRPSQIEATAQTEQGVVTGVAVGGHTTVAGHGEITLPDP